MEDFWKSVQTIQAERGADYRAFSLFSATHWAELLGAAAVIFLCAVIYYRCREVTRHQILRAVFVLMLADEFMKQAVLLYTGQWNVTYLPLHLCSINIFVCWYDAIHQSRWSKEILYALCIPGAVVAMLSPSWQRLPVWNLLHLHSYSIHVLLILYPVLLLAGGFRPQVHHIRWVLAFLCAIATPIFFLNRLLKTNFFFLNDPQGNAITAFFAHCFGERFYLLGFLPVLAAVLLLLYLPWYRAERHQRIECSEEQRFSCGHFGYHLCSAGHSAGIGGAEVALQTAQGGRSHWSAAGNAAGYCIGHWNYAILEPNLQHPAAVQHYGHHGSGLCGAVSSLYGAVRHFVLYPNQ